MAESVYKIIELVGTSTESWEKATAAAVRRASKTLRDLRIAEVSTGRADQERQDRLLSRQGEAVVQVRGEVAVAAHRAPRTVRAGRCAVEAMPTPDDDHGVSGSSPQRSEKAMPRS